MTSLRVMAFMTLAAGLLAVCEGFGKGGDSSDCSKISESDLDAECVDKCTVLLLNYRAKGKYSSDGSLDKLYDGPQPPTRRNGCGKSCAIGVYDYNELYEAYPEAAAENWDNLYPFSCQIACHAKTCPKRTECRELGDAVHEANKGIMEMERRGRDENATIQKQDDALQDWKNKYPAAVAALDKGMAFGCLGLCEDDGDDTVLMMYYTHFKGLWNGAHNPPLHFSKDEDGVEQDLFSNTCTPIEDDEDETEDRQLVETEDVDCDAAKFQGLSPSANWPVQCLEAQCAVYELEIKKTVGPSPLAPSTPGGALDNSTACDGVLDDSGEALCDFSENKLTSVGKFLKRYTAWEQANDDYLLLDKPEFTEAG